MTAFVVDASVALKWFVMQPDSALADRLLAREFELHAPDLMRAEAANGLWRYFRNGDIRQNQGKSALAKLGRTINVWHRGDDLAGDAFDLAVALDHPAYDCIYLGLARRLGTKVITADRRLVGKVEKTACADLVISLAEFARGR
jgi:hypothetical protein